MHNTFLVYLGCLSLKCATLMKRKIGWPAFHEVEVPIDITTLDTHIYTACIIILSTNLCPLLYTKFISSLVLSSGTKEGYPSKNLEKLHLHCDDNDYDDG